MKRFSIFALAAVAMFVGCTKDFDTDVKVDDGIVRGELVEMSLVFEDTRVERDQDSGKLSWSEGDQVAVVLSNDSKYTLDTEKYTVNHNSGKVTIPSNAAYVIYPANILKSVTEAGVADLTLPETVSIETNNSIFDHTPMKGSVNGNVVTFNNLMAYAKFPVTGTGKLTSAVLRTICRTTTDFQPISNKATIDITKDIANGGGVTMASNNSSFSWMRQNFSGDGIDLSTETSLYFPVPAGNYENMGLVLVTSEGAHTIYANNAHTFTRSKIKSVANKPINLADIKPATPISLAGTTGNAAHDYASCYMVPPTAGSYVFPCTLVDGTELKGGVTAEIKWAEEAGMINNLFYDKNSNSISFKTNGKEGNALIVLTDNTSSGSVLVWSWHIWITDTPKTLSVTKQNDNNTKYYVMDRVVGATWAPASTIAQTSTITIETSNIPMNNTLALSDASDACGVYFQYQNRIPYPRIKSLDFIGGEELSTLKNTRCDVMYGFYQYAQYWDSSSGCESVTINKYNDNQYCHKAMLLPNYEYSNSKAWTNANVINQYNNTDPTNSVLIDQDGNKYRFWNSVNNNNHDIMMKGKTSHDPCPPGYIMENASITYWYIGMRSKEIGYTRAKDDNSAYSSGFKFYGMYYNSAKDSAGNTTALYWPCAGQRENGRVGVSGQYGNCGYVYAVNTNNTETYVGGSNNTIGKATAIVYGERLNDYKAPGFASWDAKKLTNQQAYPVRCRRGKF